MRASGKILIALVSLLLAVAGTGVFLTRTPSGPVAVQPKQGPPPPPLVDEQPLRTARAVSILASTIEEEVLSKKTLHIADHDVDLAFAMAMRNATENPPVPTPEIKEILERVKAAQDSVDEDQREIADLTKQVAAATGARKDKLQTDLDEAKAELEPDLDELEDAKHELIDAGGDPGARIAQMKEAHEAAQHEGAPPAAPSTSQQSLFRGGLAADFGEWRRLSSKETTLSRAQTEAQEKAEALSDRRDALKSQLDAAREKAPLLGPKATAEERAAAQKATRRLRAEREELSDFEKRVSDEKALRDLYTQWAAIAGTQVRAALHVVLLDCAWLLLVLLALVGLSAWFDHLFRKLPAEKRRLMTLHTVLRMTLQTAAIVVALLFVFGLPAQIATMIGLAGAGLTVALKDFIVGFFGWIVLMGKNGIRVGDWVEISGVSGEVAEIGLFRTVLLETGNWTDAGHPTGRRVSFANGFAIEGHYFNFSTAGQWLWDELVIVLPVSENPYPVVDGIRKTVAATTAQNVREAEEEWRHATRSRGMGTISAEPAINIRPSPMGIEIAVRYITRANERSRLRTKLYDDIVGLLGHRAPGGSPESARAAAGES